MLTQHIDQTYQAFKYYQLIKSKSNNIILVGSKTSKTDYYFLYIQFSLKAECKRPLNEIIFEKGPYQSYEQIKQQIKKYIPSSQQTSKLYINGIIGFKKLFQGYYLIYVTQSHQIGRIGRHKIFQIRKTEIIRLFQLNQNNNLQTQLKHFQLLEGNKFQNFYYSFTYDLTSNFSKNINQTKFIYRYKEVFKNPKKYYSISEMFMWNYYILDKIKGVCMNYWFVPIIHGYCKQLKKIEYNQKIFNLIIIARRSRHHSGTRYIKRGLNQNGYVANHVQIQQILLEQNNQINKSSSYVQVRGSVPVFWFQQPHILIVQPSINVYDQDKNNICTKKHFSDLVQRYGKNVLCVNLVRKNENTPKQGLLSQKFRNAVENNKEYQYLKYIELDLKYMLKDAKSFRQNTSLLAYYLVLNTGIFAFLLSEKFAKIFYQNGVIRTNCVDCLDRTNSFQQVIGLMALKMQLSILCNQQFPKTISVICDKFLNQFEEIYEQMGNVISIQYGGSESHPHKVRQESQQKIKPLVSIKRHWNNNIHDDLKQQKMDIFLGHYRRQKPYIYDLKFQIKFEPNKDILENYNRYWYSQSYSNFKNQHMTQFLRKITVSQENQYFQNDVFQIFSQLQQFRIVYNNLKKYINNFVMDKCAFKNAEYFFYKIPWKHMVIKQKQLCFNFKPTEELIKIVRQLFNKRQQYGKYDEIDTKNEMQKYQYFGVDTEVHKKEQKGGGTILYSRNSKYKQ